MKGGDMMEENKTAKQPERTAVERAHPLLLIREVLRKLWAVVMVTIIFASCGYVAAAQFYTPQYQTRTTFVVSTRGNSASVYSNLNAATGMAQSFSQVLGSDVMKKRVAQELGVEQIDGEITASAISETNLLEMRVTSDNPRMAYLITRAVINNYDDLASAVLSNISLEILQQPRIPTAPVNASGAQHTAKLAGLAGAALVVILVCVRAYLRDTVKSEDEVEAKLDTRMLAAVRHERKYKTFRAALAHKKTSILITNPTTGFLFVETFKKLRTRVEYQMRRSRCKVIMVTSVLEDEGKSTVSVNLALAMGRKYKNVLLIDADMKKPAVHKILGYQEEKYSTLPELLEGKVALRDALLVDPERHVTTLLGRRGVENATELSGGTSMRQLIAAARQQMDIVIIDTPPMAVSPDAECIADIADAAVLVVRQDQAPVRVINDMIDVLNHSKAELLGCVLNNFYSADFTDRFSYGYGGQYGYGGKYGYGKYGYGGKRAAVPEEGEETE